MKFINQILLIIFIFSINPCYSQSYFAAGISTLYRIDIGENACSCSFDYIGSTGGSPNYFPCNGLTFCPDTSLVLQVGSPYLYEVDTLTANLNQIFAIPGPPGSGPNVSSLVCVGGGIFYAIKSYGSELYRYNLNSGSFNLMGSTGIQCKGDLALFNGNIYYPTVGGIVLLDTTNLSNSSIVVNFPSQFIIFGLTASHFCNSLLGFGAYANQRPQLILINIVDEAITLICDFPDDVPWDVYGISSILEFSTFLDCDVSLDLDCDNSSGATDADYNSPEYDCLSPGVGIADEDIKMLYDAIISTMTIQIVGNVPDAPNEILNMIGSVAGINATGIGTDMITLSNAGGAKSTDFKDALRLIVYQNTAEPLTPGPRTVQVQFTTESGQSSNIATAFIDVICITANVS